MLLTITTTREPATDLGYLLHKHPGRFQSRRMSSGAAAHVFYPEASASKCTAALLLDVDPVGLASSNSCLANEAPACTDTIPIATSASATARLGRRGVTGGTRSI
ncbi:MAG: hypothetical protein J2P25_22550 [Nocardiopsaceae bacterium]|nr:hypothetical protein [Nocardiopsaceae bacterium]